MFNFERAFDAAEERSRRLERLLEKLRLDQPAKPPEVGDRVLCCASLIGCGCGQDWERIEATVIEVASTSCRIEFTHEFSKRKDSHWIPNEVITDILSPVSSERAQS